MANDLYDPQAVEHQSTASQYLTLNDVKKIGLVVIAIAILLIPIYRWMLANSEKTRCKQSMRAIAEAINLYAQEHDNRYPPVGRTESQLSVVPTIGDHGYAYTWASDIQPLMNKRHGLRCPTASDQEAMQTEDPADSSKAFPLTYGIYGPYAGFQTSLIDNPDSVILLAETANRGAGNTFDPKPLVSLDGKQRDDAFVIGWDTGGTYPTDQSKYVTRLAYPETKGGQFVFNGESRHGKAIHFMTASGKLVTGGPQTAQIARNRDTGAITGYWAVPPKSLLAR